MARALAVRAGCAATGWAGRLGDRYHHRRLERACATTIVDTGPYRFTRNPIYLGMFFGLVGLAIAFDSLWLLVRAVCLRPRHPLRRNGSEGSLSSANSATPIAATVRVCGAGCSDVVLL